MYINRSNYEEFFLLYIDNELSTEQREALNDFIQQNPDLEKELLILKQFTLEPDANIVFTNKGSLIPQQAIDITITIDNLQDFFILYADDELSNRQKAAVEEYVYHHPRFQAEFELIQSLRYNPDRAITFSQKESLYRHEKAANTLGFRWWNVAAAGIILFIGIFWLTRQSLHRPQVQFVQSKTSVKQPFNENIVQPINPDNNSKEPGLHQQKTLREISQKKTFLKQPDFTKNKTESIGEIKPGDNPVIELSAITINNPRQMETSGYIALHKIDPASSEIYPMLVKQQSGIIDDQSGSASEESNVIFPSSDKPDNIYFANLPLNKKQFFRGLIRKTSRFMNKQSEIRNAEMAGLKIGNVEIAIQ